MNNLILFWNSSYKISKFLFSKCNMCGWWLVLCRIPFKKNSSHIIYRMSVSKTQTFIARCCLCHGWWTPFRRNGVRNDLCDWFASIYAAGSQWWKGWVQSYTEKKGEFDLSLAHACYHFSLKYHRALSDFPVGCSHHETTNCDIGS